MNTNTNINTNKMNTTNTNDNTIKKYENFSSFYKKDIYIKDFIKYLILGNKLHQTKDDKPKIFRNYNRKIKHNKNRNIYPMKDTNRR